MAAHLRALLGPKKQEAPPPKVGPQELARRLMARLREGEKSSLPPLAPSRAPAPVPEPWIAFASGLKPGQIYGFAELGRGVGFSLAERREGVSADLGAKAWKGYLDVLDRIADELPGGFTLLVDNGAVQEVDLATMTAVAPISDAAWQKRMVRYAELASRYGDAVWLITPDRIGDQRETIRRFKLCAPALREAVSLGATLVLTLQPGELDPVSLEARLLGLLALDSSLTARRSPLVIPAFPMRLRGDDRRATVTPLPVLVDFVRRRRPRTVHLLGMGLKSKLLPDVLRAIQAVSPETRVTLDSAEVRAVAVQGRPWIAEKPWAEAQVRRRPAYRQGSVREIDETEILLDLPPEALRAAALEAGLDPACAERFAEDPEILYALFAAWDEADADDPCWGACDPQVLDLALLHERFRREAKFPSSAGASERDRLLVHRVFGKKR